MPWPYVQIEERWLWFYCGVKGTIIVDDDDNLMSGGFEEDVCRGLMRRLK